MLALFFEVTPRPGHDGHYFGIAAALKPRVEANGGLLFLDRYRGLARPDTILSYQHWAGEAALVRWREDAKHLMAQKAGRETHFAGYRIRVAAIVEGFARGGEEPAGVTGSLDGDGESGERLVMAVESLGGPFPRGEPFASVNREGAYASVLHVAGRDEAREILRDAETRDNVTRAIVCRVVRDYSMHDRREAPPQFAPAEAGPSG